MNETFSYIEELIRYYLSHMFKSEYLINNISNDIIAAIKILIVADFTSEISISHYDKKIFKEILNF